MPVAVFCPDCGATGIVSKVTPGLQCRCGSTDLGLDGVDPKPSVHLAAPHGPGTGWGRPMPDPTANWNDYPGQLAGPNPHPPAAYQRWSCPECQGSGYDLIDKTRCKACKGTGLHTPPTAGPYPPPLDPHPGPDTGGAVRWQARSAQRVSTPHGPQSPSAGSPAPSPAPVPVRAAMTQPAPGTPYLLATASCPACHSADTALAADRSGHGWWRCYRCGSLADLDARPDVDPYTPPPGFRPDRRMKTRASRFRARSSDGRLLAMLAAIHSGNDLSPQEALTLARRALVTHGDQ